MRSDGVGPLARARVVIGSIGDDIHVVGITILAHALRGNGAEVIQLGIQTSAEEFIAAALAEDADAVFVSSSNGHAGTAAASTPVTPAAGLPSPGTQTPGSRRGWGTPKGGDASQGSGGDSASNGAETPSTTEAAAGAVTASGAQDPTPAEARASRKSGTGSVKG